jgi:glycosyltransferase involved in cell wall biosynthesis
MSFSATESMTLSVAMAVKDGERHLAAAIDSVLAQSFADFEFLIVDDASCDRTPEILAHYARRDSRIAVFRNATNLGPYPSANLAISRARGRYIARHDADDVSPQDRFAVQLAALESNPAACLVTGGVEVFVDGASASSTVMRPASWQPKLEWDLLFSNVVGAGAHVMFPRIVRGAPVRFPATHRYAEDYGLWCRLVREGQVVCPVDVVYRYRCHGSSITSRYKADQDACMFDMRQGYQSTFLRSAIDPAQSRAISSFWRMDSSRTVAAGIEQVPSILKALRAGFLSDVDSRYGRQARLRASAELERDCTERIAYWLVRAIRCRDAHGFRHVAAMPASASQATRVSAEVCRRLAAAAVRRVTRIGTARQRELGVSQPDRYVTEASSRN